MRRIYESEALDGDNEDPFRPNEPEERAKPQASRTIPAMTLSNLLVPTRIRYRGISVAISTPKAVYGQDEPIPIEIRMRNSLPFPVSLPTTSQVVWSWAVNDIEEASHVHNSDSSESGQFPFGRGELKQFRRTWSQMFQVSEKEWEPAEAGEYCLSTQISVPDAKQRGLYDETTIQIE